jgi:very-short-patch-repair endonuclease
LQKPIQASPAIASLGTLSIASDREGKCAVIGCIPLSGKAKAGGTCILYFRPMFEPSIIELCRNLRRNQTPSEARLWKRLKAKQFDGYKFRRQHPIIYESRQGIRRFFIPDFYCSERNLIVELDGKIHEFQKDYDDNRDFVLAQLGLKTIRILNEELWDMNSVLEKIFAAL